MIQTAIFNYFNCNDNDEQLNQPKYKPSSLKQTNLTDYFKTIPKKKNLILDYFKSKEKKEKEKIFDLVLVDIKNSVKTITSVKKNMYDEDLKYIAISYRWGENEEQLVKTPDYIAHITSFVIADLMRLCYFITREPDLKEIQYLWIDAISVNQNNHARKKETILKMNQIYKNASYILAVPDLHRYYLRKNSANREVMGLINKYMDIIHEDIINIKHPSTNPIKTYNHSDIQSKENEDESENDEEELKKAYTFLAYLVDDWSNRAWVISEYQIAKEKHKQHETPLKYIFISLLHKHGSNTTIPFFSYTFVDHHEKNDNPKMNDTKINYYHQVDDGNKFMDFLESRFIQRSHINMILGSHATRNEDRFHAILPSWNKYQHLIKNKNTISNWNITDLLSVKLKLYEIIYDDDDLWDKARLLYMCSNYAGKPILPSFATYSYKRILVEKDNIGLAHEYLLNFISQVKIKIKGSYKDAQEYIEYYEKNHGSIFKENLTDIQFNKKQQHLIMKANKCFVFNTPSVSSIFNQEELSKYSLQDDDNLQLIYIPFFIYRMPRCRHFFPINEYRCPSLSGTLLLGNTDINRWIKVELHKCKTYGRPSLCSTNGYIYHIY